MSDEQPITFAPVPPLTIEDMNLWWEYISRGMIRTRRMTREEFKERYPDQRLPEESK